jgi:hypothetical protein
VREGEREYERGKRDGGSGEGELTELSTLPDNATWPSANDLQTVAVVWLW